MAKWFCTCRDGLSQCPMQQWDTRGQVALQAMSHISHSPWSVLCDLAAGQRGAWSLPGATTFPDPGPCLETGVQTPKPPVSPPLPPPASDSVLTDQVSCGLWPRPAPHPAGLLLPLQSLPAVQCLETSAKGLEDNHTSQQPACLSP